PCRQRGVVVGAHFRSVKDPCAAGASADDLDFQIARGQQLPELGVLLLEPPNALRVGRMRPHESLPRTGDYDLAAPETRFHIRDKGTLHLAHVRVTPVRLAWARLTRNRHHCVLTLLDSA